MAPTPWNEALFSSTTPLRVGFFERNGAFRPCPTARRAVREAAARLEKLGHTLVPFEPPDIVHANDVYMRSVGLELGSWTREMLQGLEKLVRSLR